MKVYHGCATWNAEKLLSGKTQRFPGLFVTDTFEHASRYANSQARHEVIGEYIPLQECAAIIEMEVEPVEWWTRGEDHWSLDAVEAVVREWTVISVTVKRPAYWNSDQHKVIDRMAAQVKVIES